VRWAIGSIIVALAAVVAVNAVLLAYGGQRNDPVGKLSPVAEVVHAPRKTVPLPTIPPPTTTTDRRDHDRDSDD